MKIIQKICLAVCSVLVAVPAFLGLVFISLKNFLDLKSRKVNFKPRKSDIFIVTYPRSGTTWMQMIMHQVINDGNMDFLHISEKCPWLERAYLNPVIAIDTYEDPRVIKTHYSYKDIPKGNSKYIYVARSGKDVAVSFFHHYKSILGYKGDFNEFYHNKFIKGEVQYGSWFEHVHDWWRNPDKLDLLFLTYEELSSDFEGTIRKIAAFCNVDLDDERMARICERSAFAYMKEQEDKFEHISELHWEFQRSLQGIQLNKGSFIRKGKVNQAKPLFDEKMDALYQEQYNQWIKSTDINF
ncbi:MAG: sulfotransferase domain-containing protein [bacterium]|nr:sulfotransferase domain-containing protein [bacterium]